MRCGRRPARSSGLQGIAIPEEYGGSGFSFAEQAIVLEELGAGLYGGPYLASAVLAATALLASPDEGARQQLLPGIAAGETIAALAFTEDDGSWDPAGIRLAAAKSGDGWVLDGHKSFVLDGANAGLLLVVAVADGGLSLFAVDAAASGLTATALPTLDQTRSLARIEFAAVPADLIGSAGDGAAILDRVLDVAAIALAAEQLGGGAAGAGHHGGLHQDAASVRAADRVVPGAEAPDGRPADGGRVAAVGGRVRGVGGGRRRPTRSRRWRRC